MHLLLIVLQWLLLVCSIHAALNENSKGKLCGEEEVGHYGELNGLFYYFYESAHEPRHDPVVFWLSGGPGCSGLVALLFENGPCRVTEATSEAIPNPHSWTKVANVVFIDQPRGTGFSRASTDANAPWHEASAIDTLYSFVQAFFKQYPTFSTQPVFIFGESYAGHYVPDLATEILRRDGNSDSDLSERLQGIGIGNGLISPKAIYSTVLDMALENTYQHQFDLLDEKTIAKLRKYESMCLEAIEECQHNNCTNIESCQSIMGTVLAAVRKQGLNAYDLRARCHDDPFELCYRFENLFVFANSDDTKAALGEAVADKSWEPCNNQLFQEHETQDWFRESEFKIPALLEQGIRVLIYAGDADVMCNWIGQEKWTKGLDWTYQTEFSAQSMTRWGSTGDDGECRSYKNLSFLRVFDSGHVSG